MSTETTQDTARDLPADLQRYLADPLAADAQIDLDALDEGRFALHGASADPAVDAAQDAAEQLLDAENAQTDSKTTADSAAATPTDDTGSVAQPPAESAQADSPVDPQADALVALRQRAAQAEALAAELARENTALKAQPQTAQPPAATVDDQTLASLREDAPDIAEALEKLMAQNRELAEQVQAREAAARESEQKNQLQSRIDAQVATDSNSH